MVKYMATNGLNDSDHIMVAYGTNIWTDVGRQLQWHNVAVLRWFAYGLNMVLIMMQQRVIDGSNNGTTE